MKWSAVLVADVPSGVVTVTSTMPVPAGETALTRCRVARDGGGHVPKGTAVTKERFVPEIVTVVPPAAGPSAARWR